MAEEKKNRKAVPTDGLRPQVPLALEGSWILHQMFRLRWRAWRTLDSQEQEAVVEEAAAVFGQMERVQEGQQQTGLFSLLGHKGDLMLVHFRRKIEQLNEAELSLARLKLHAFMEPTTSYVSVVELGLYEASVKLYDSLRTRGVQPWTPEWNEAVEGELEKQRQAAQARLWPLIPPRPYICFYPMNKLRGA